MSSSQSPSKKLAPSGPARSTTDKDVVEFVVEQPAPGPAMTTQEQPAMRVRGGCCPCVRYPHGVPIPITYAYCRIAFHAAAAAAVEGGYLIPVVRVSAFKHH